MVDADTLAEAGRGGHSVFAPSAAAMWLQCPGSLLPHLAHPDTAGFDAAQGTVAHLMASTWLTEGEPRHLIGSSMTVEAGGQDHEIQITTEMLNHVAEYVQWCRDLPGAQMVEQRVTFSQYTPISNQGGTADHIALLPLHLTITDLKYGFIQVFAEDNPQLMLYALGVFLEWDWLYAFERITLRICQPRLDHFDAHEISRDDLLTFAEYVRDRAALCLEPSPPRSPSPKACRWCNVRLTCPAFAGVLDRLADDTFTYEADAEAMQETLVTLQEGGKPEIVSPIEMETGHLARVLAYRSLMESWFGQIFEELKRRAGDGEPIEGWKMVPGRSSRAWEGPGAPWRLSRAAGLPLDALMAPPAPLSPYQASKTLRAAGFKPAEIERMMNKLVRVTPGPRTLVPAGDTRESLKPIADQTFSYGADE